MNLNDLWRQGMPRFLDRLRGPFGSSSGPRGTAVAIASGKGGTGKTFVTINLAVLAGAAAGAGRVAVLDADLGLGNAHLLLGLRPRRNLQDFLEERCGLAELLQRSNYGVDILPGGSGISRLCQLESGEMRRLSRALSRELPGAVRLFVDSAAGISPQTLRFLLAADLVLLVVTPELTSLTDAYAMVKCLHLRGLEAPVAAIVNRADTEAQAAQAFERLREVARRFLGIDVSPCGWIPEDPAVRRALAARVPLVVRAPQAPAARALRRCARRLTELLGQAGGGRRTQGYAERLLGKRGRGARSRKSGSAVPPAAP